VIYCVGMDKRFHAQSSLDRWIVFICGMLCIAAVGISSRFIELRREERQRRLAAEHRLEDVTSQLQLLGEKNRELAEQLREARKIAAELAREREQVETVITEASPRAESSETKPRPEEPIPAVQQKGTRLMEALKAFPWERVSRTVSGVGSAAGEGWSEFRIAFVSSFHSARAENEPPPERRPSRLLASIKRFPVGGLVRMAGNAQDSAGEAFGKLREQVASGVRAATSAGPPRAASPSEAPSETTKKLTATDEELRQELAEVRQEKRELERKIAERIGEIPGSVNVGQVKISTGRRFSGRVLVVNEKHNFVVIDIGKIHGLETGVVLIVHRGNKFIGKVQVIKVYEKMAAADLVMDWMQDDVRVSDGVKKF
jgi:hypothetical protein